MLSLPFKDSVGSGVEHLGGASHPPHVAGFIVAVVVSTIQGELFRGAWTDALIESGEVIEPSIAHLDSSGSITLECGVIGVVAPSLDA